MEETCSWLRCLSLHTSARAGALLAQRRAAAGGGGGGGGAAARTTRPPRVPAAERRELWRIVQASRAGQRATPGARDQAFRVFLSVNQGCEPVPVQRLRRLAGMPGLAERQRGISALPTGAAQQPHPTPTPAAGAHPGCGAGRAAGAAGGRHRPAPAAVRAAQGARRAQRAQRPGRPATPPRAALHPAPRRPAGRPLHVVLCSGSSRTARSARRL